MRRFLPLAAAIAAPGPRRRHGPVHGARTPAVIKGVAFLKSQDLDDGPGPGRDRGPGPDQGRGPAERPGPARRASARFCTTFDGGRPTPLPRRAARTSTRPPVVLLALVNIDPIAYKPQIDAVRSI